MKDARHAWRHTRKDEFSITIGHGIKRSIVTLKGTYTVKDRQMNLFIGAHLIADAQDPFNLSPWLENDFQIVRKIFRFNLAVSLFIHGYDAGHPGGWWEGKPTVAVRCNQQLRTATPFQICVTKPEGVIIRDNQSHLRADCRLAVGGKNDDATEARRLVRKPGRWMF